MSFTKVTKVLVLRTRGRPYTSNNIFIWFIYIYIWDIWDTQKRKINIDREINLDDTVELMLHYEDDYENITTFVTQTIKNKENNNNKNKRMLLVNSQINYMPTANRKRIDPFESR